MLQYNYSATVHYKSEISYIKRIMVTSIVYHAIYSTGSRGDLFVVRTSKPVENLRLSVWEKKSKEREGKGGGEGGGIFSLKIGLLGTPCLCRPSGDVPCASEDMACGY